MAESENSNILKAIAFGAIAFFLWRLFSRKSNVIVSDEPEPSKEPNVNDQFVGQPLNCENIVYKPLTAYGPFPSNLLGKNWCYRGDGSFFDGKKVTYGDRFADEQAQTFSEAKQLESVRAINKKVIQFRLINSTAAKITTEILDTAKTANPVFTPLPDAPVASAATGVTSSGFTANWALSANATGYYLDVATDSAFTSFVSGYQNLDVGNVLTKVITGLNELTNYYYRIRGYNSTGTSENSNTITATTLQKTFADWFLPSKDELNDMRVNLDLHGVGGFVSDYYWASSELNIINAHRQNFSGGLMDWGLKSNSYRVRACRSFTAAIGAYSLRDTGPAGGLIFYISGTTYYEAAPTDQSSSKFWSNIIDQLIGTTSIVVGEGQNNTNEIIAQAGHTDSAAKLCDDLIITNG